MRNPFKKQPKTDFIDEPLERQFRVEAGFTAIKGTEFTKLRVENADQGIIEIINLKIEEYNTLLKRAGRLKKSNEQLDKRIDHLAREIQLWTFYRQFKRASAPWATAGEDHEMSQRLRATEILYFRNVHKPWTWNMVMMVLQYVSDVCYKEWHVAPAPTILVQTPILGRGGSGIGDTANSGDTTTKIK